MQGLVQAGNGFAIAGGVVQEFTQGEERIPPFFARRESIDLR